MGIDIRITCMNIFLCFNIFYTYYEQRYTLDFIYIEQKHTL